MSHIEYSKVFILMRGQIGVHWFAERGGYLSIVLVQGLAPSSSSCYNDDGYSSTKTPIVLQPVLQLCRPVPSN